MSEVKEKKSSSSSSSSKKKSSSSSSSSKDKEKKEKRTPEEEAERKKRREERKQRKEKEKAEGKSEKKKSSSKSKDGEKKKSSKSSSSKSSSSKDKKKEHKKEEKPAASSSSSSAVEEYVGLEDSGDEGDTTWATKSFPEKYIVGPELGRGAFSVVKEVTSTRSGRKYACKFIEKKNVGQDMVRLRTEIEILTRVKHPNIINLKEIVEDDNTLFIITEMVTGGELFDKIVELGAYTEKEAAELVRKMVSAIDYLHSMNIVHRDLKPENLLLKSPDDVSNIKLADFGLSKIVGQQVMMQTACGTPGYVAPEVLNATGYGPEVDLWSIGVITYILLCGFPPFYNESLPLLFEQIMKAEYDYPPDYWDEISDTAKNFIDRLLQVNPESRMNTKQALEHPWLTGRAGDHKLKTNQKMGDTMRKYREESRANVAK